MRLKDRVAIVTGGAGGIGRTYVLALAGEGAKVVIADVDGSVSTSVAYLDARDCYLSVHCRQTKVCYPTVVDEMNTPLPQPARQWPNQ